MDYYYGLTIGPVVKTITSVQATRELWGASYLFSRLMGDILQRVSQLPDITILSPAVELPEETKSMGTGLFPDKMFVKGSEANGKEIQQKIQDAVLDIGKEIAAELGADPKKVQQFLSRFFQTYLVRVQEDEEQNPVMFLNQLMDTAELRPPFQTSEPEDERFLMRYFDRINQSSMKRNAFLKGDRDIDSLPEIALRELETDTVPVECRETYGKILKEWKEKEREALEFRLDAQKVNSPGAKKLFKDLSKEAEPETLFTTLAGKKIEVKPHLKNYHKYVALVYADGDNVSKIIENLPVEKDTYEDFSGRMLSFGVEAVVEIKGFGGFSVYVGGDDLMFFAPVIYRGKTIFHLVSDLDNIFREKMTGMDFPKETPPSLSFGVSMSYYKFPMHESLGTARSLLFDTAKGFKPQKNAVAFRLQKHSGSYFESLMPIKNSQVFVIFSDLLAGHMKDSDRLLSSVAFHLERNETLLHSIGNNPERMDNFFRQQFNEDIHTGEGKPYLDQVRGLVLACYQESESPEKAQKTLYSLLRILHFLTQKYLHE